MGGPADGVRVDTLGMRVVVPIVEPCGDHVSRAEYDADGQFALWVLPLGSAYLEARDAVVRRGSE